MCLGNLIYIFIYLIKSETLFYLEGYCYIQILWMTIRRPAIFFLLVINLIIIILHVIKVKQMIFIQSFNIIEITVIVYIIHLNHI